MAGESKDACVTMTILNKFIRMNPTCVTSKLDQLMQHLKSFVRGNEDPAMSINLKLGGEDDMTCMVGLLTDKGAIANAELTLLILKVFKCLLRKAENRASIDDRAVKSIISVLKAPADALVAREVANVALNLCYDRSNVKPIVDGDCAVPLVGFLGSSDMELVASAAGALQSLCYSALGRLVVREAGGVPAVLKHIKSENDKVLMRVMGVLHNVTSDPKVVGMVRDEGHITTIVGYLRHPNPRVCGSAAGATQNLSRDEDVRKVISETDAVGALAELLAGSDPRVQASSAGALLNLLGPVVGEPEKGEVIPAREGLKVLLADLLALGACQHVLWEDP